MGKNDIFLITAELKLEFKNSFAHTYVTRIIVIIYHTPKFRFYLIDFQLNTDFSPMFAFFTLKLPSFTQRSVSQKIVLNRSKNQSFFFSFSFLQDFWLE